MDTATETAPTQAADIPESTTRSKAELAIEVFDSHLKRCPVKTGKGELPPMPVETYVVEAPAIRDTLGGIAVTRRRVRVTRCVECGGHEVNDPRGEAYRDELAAEDDEDV